jgi:tight adherence protein C
LVLDAPHHRECAVILSPSLWASVAGLSTIAVVFVLALAARPSAAAAPRRPPPPPACGAPARPARLRFGRRRRRLAVAVLVLVSALAFGPVPTIALVASVPVVLSGRRRVSATRAARAVEAAMPSAIELVVVCIHAGLTPARTIDVAAGYVDAAVRPGFEAVRLQLQRGRPLADALPEMVTVLGSPARELVSAIAAADRDGLPLAPVLDRLALTARAERRRQGEAAARRLPVQLSFPLVACTLPSFVLLTIAPAVLGAVSTLRGSAP